MALTSKPERFQILEEVFLFRAGQALEPGRFQVESVREHLRGWLFKFRGVETMSQAELLARLVRERVSTSGREEELRDPGFGLDKIFGE